MDNVTAQFTTNPSSVAQPSYVDAYTPPSTSAVPVAQTSSAPVQEIAQPAATPLSPSVASAPSVPAASIATAMQSPPSVVPTVSSVKPITSPTEDVVVADKQSNTQSDQSQSEELEDQNIFAMLGVLDGTPQQRESFLDELQQVIWEDFLEYDVKLLVTKDEQVELDRLLAESATSELEKQEKIVVYLEKLIPDLEEIMLEKALELKEEMMRERVKGMREYYKDKTESLTNLDKAEELMNVGKWRSAATLLNSIR